MERTILRVALVLAVGVTAAVLLTDRLPLGVPGEWTWSRVELTRELAISGLLPLAAGVIYVGFALLGALRIGRAGTTERGAWLVTLVVVAFGWLGGALDSVPPPHGYSRVPWVLYYPRSSGYFWQARYDVEDAKTFLAGYEDLLAERDVLHIGTHPPGLTLSYFGLLHLCRSFPSLTDAVLRLQPPGVREGFRLLQEMSQPGEHPLEPADTACLWLAALLTQLAAVSTCVVLYFLARRHFDRRAAWFTACLWPLVPAVAVFFPKSDVVYAFPAVTSAWLWLSACDRQSPLRALGSGIVLWIGMMLSLAFLTVLALLGVMSLWEVRTRTRVTEYGRPRFLSFKILVLAAIGFLVPTIALAVFADVNLFNVWAWNYSNHALFYEEYERNWQAWLKVNPLELAFAVGLPVAVTAVWGIGRLLRSGEWSTARGSAAMSFLCVWGLLWLSGKNMGEAARLWILLMPWVVLAAGGAFANEAEAEAAETTGLPRRWRSLPAWVLIAQLAAALMTILRVDGFHFAELLVG